MNNALYLFESEVETLKKYVRENTTLSVFVDTSSYPVKISFFEDYKQITFFDNEEKQENSDRAAELQFIFHDKMQIKTQEDFGISEEVFNKLKNLSKEVNRLFLNAFFEKMNYLKNNIEKTFGKGISKIGASSTSYDGKEFYLAVIYPQVVIDNFIKSVGIEVEE